MATQLTLPRTSEEPDIAELTRLGWSVISSAGPYFSVWKDCEEKLLIWKDSRWVHVGGAGYSDS